MHQLIFYCWNGICAFPYAISRHSISESESIQSQNFWPISTLLFPPNHELCLSYTISPICRCWMIIMTETVKWFGSAIGKKEFQQQWWFVVKNCTMKIHIAVSFYYYIHSKRGKLSNHRFCLMDLAKNRALKNDFDKPLNIIMLSFMAW